MPDGLMVFDGENHFFCKSGKLFRVVSKRAVQSWGLDPVLVSPAFTIDYDGFLGFRDGTLIKDISSGRIYLVSGSKVRLVTSPDVLDILGRDRIIEVGPDEVAIHKVGDDLNGL